MIARRHELAVRMALGASRQDIYRLVARETGLMVAAGLIVGVPVALLAAHALRGFLFGVSPVAPHVYLVSGLVIAAACFTAAILPAHRAAHLDPASEIRR